MMNKVHIDSCPVCTNDGCTQTLICKDHLATGELFPIYQCSNCSFAFTQNFPSELEIGKYYDAPEYISHSDTHQGVINSLYHWARKIALKSKTRIASKYSSDNAETLLDIGSGTGYFLNAMRLKKWVVTGIEKSKSTREYAHKKFGLNIQDAEYLFEMPDKVKDVVTMWHVLEHIEKLNETMSNLHRILKDDGVLVIALPNKKSADALSYKEQWAAYDVPRHLWHFSPDDFTYFAQKHNFKIEKKKAMYFDPFYIAMLSEKNKGTFAASLVGLIKGSFFFIQSLFSTYRCSSIIYILKKK